MELKQRIRELENQLHETRKELKEKKEEIQNLKLILEELEDRFMTQLPSQLRRINGVVPKKLQRGPRGAFFYMNSDGKKIFLNHAQRKKHESGQLSGCIGDQCLVHLRNPEMPV